MCYGCVYMYTGTKSNEWSGKRTFGGRSLHEIDDPSVQNPYEDVIETIGKTLRDFGASHVPHRCVVHLILRRHGGFLCV